VYDAASRAWWGGANMYGRLDAPDLYRYSPTFAVLVSPFTLLPPGAGNAAWKLANVAVFVAGVWAWGYRVLPWVATRERIMGLFFVAAIASLPSFFNGQANLMVTGFILLGLAGLAAECWWSAAVWLAAATLIKVFPLALALTLCVVYWRTFPARFAIVLLGGFMLPFVTQDPQYVQNQMKEWLHHLTATNECPRPGHRSLDVLLELVGLGIDRREFQLLAIASGGVVLAIAVRARRSHGARESLTVTAAWFLTWAILFGPATENPTFAVLAPVLAWVVVAASERPGAWFERAWLLACVYLMCLSTSDAGGPYRRFFNSIAATTIGALMFQVWLFAELFQRRAGLAAQRESEPAPAVTPRRAA
jgi:hypothetical protein